jgi:hypothetical protein
MQRNIMLMPQEMRIVSSQNYTNTYEDPGESRDHVGQNSYSSSELFVKNKEEAERKAIHS